MHKAFLARTLFTSLAAAGVQSVYVEHLNLKPYMKKRLWETLQYASAEVQAVYSSASTTVHRQALHDMVMELIGKYKLTPTSLKYCTTTRSMGLLQSNGPLTIAEGRVRASKSANFP